ncbi:DUF1604-domain-containing protein [Thozetella sp. PMI_491]|nr:DUF1604-domain-containing protein [Thozetella sp. PMI_491]
MSYKRSRATYEADLIEQQSPFVLFGTPLPPLDPEVRDDGSYVPLWKQEVRDERGRKRLHGAFTGGWSAGYFNTVGSKEGWTPSTFVSSRTNRRKDAPNAPQLRPEDFMDEEDLREAEESRQIQTSDAFAGLGSTDRDAARATGLLGLFRIEGQTMGVKLLKKMGWKEGQGIGPKVRRKARLEMRTAAGDPAETFLFAPEDVAMIAFVKKTNRKGLGFAGEARLAPLSSSRRNLGGSEEDDEEDDDEDEDNRGGPKFTIGSLSKKKSAKSKGGMGIGVLNDTGSDDEDPYEIGPRISYNRVIGGDKKKKKKLATAVNPALKNKPTFISKKAALTKVGLGVRKCHDGRLPLDGFVFGKDADALTSAINSEGKYPPPKIPPDWKPAKQPTGAAESTSEPYVSTADVAKASALDPKARAALLGEKQLPGKSVFDFMSPAARQQLAQATGRTDLPEAKGEIPKEYALSEEERLQQVLDQAPRIDKQTAVAAMSRGTGAGAPYVDNEEKRARYRAYLEYSAGFRKDLPSRPPKTSNDDWLRELHEFASCARIFKPMTGSMASRFTTSSSGNTLASGSSADVKTELVSRPPPKPQDPAEEAARLGMFGPMTRSAADFFPVRLLCKRFNVKPPEHVQPEQDYAAEGARPEPSSSRFASAGYYQERPARLNDAGPSEEPSEQARPPPKEVVAIDSSKNEALEGKRAGEDVFKAIFGDSDDDEEDE